MEKIRNIFVLALMVAAVAASAYFSADTSAQTSGAAPSATPPPTPNPEDEEIKIDTEVVNVLFTAQDKDRRLLLGLKKEDVQILEDGKPQPVQAFSRQVDLPMSLAILIDTSIS